MNQAVSVVMAVYNGRRFLAPQIDSVLAQLAPQDEVVVVDDASSDGSGDWLIALGDSRLSVHRNPTTRGVLASFERGLALARNPLLFLCDQDDVWLPGKRETMVASFGRDERTLAVVSDAEIIDGDGRVVAPSFMATRGGFRGSVWSTLLRNRYLGCAMALRRPLLAAALPIPPAVPMHDMWLGALASRLGSVRYIETPLLQYRRHAANVTPARRQSMLRMLRWRLALSRALVARLAAVRAGHDGLATVPASPRGEGNA